jgi:glycosyltransferase involved in cell wall biosynthesis
MAVSHAIYAAFDVYPSYKGAATHISQMVDTLSTEFEEVTVYSLGLNDIEVPGSNSNIVYERFLPAESNYLKRSSAYSSWLSQELRKKDIIELAHFRDLWSALAIMEHSGIVHTVYEVNAFLPVELPYRYPGISQKTRSRIDKLEMQCMQECDVIICPSMVIKKNLIKRGILNEKIHVVTNGAQVPDHYEKPADIEVPDQFIIYFGALQPWQGVDQLIKAMGYLKDYPDLKLVIAASQKSRYAKALLKLVEKLELDDRIYWYFLLEKDELNYLIHKALISIAPLTECSRNLEQGCSPIKIFESMANGTAVLASDLPVTREIISDKVNGKLLRPDRPAELARGIRLLLDNPDLRKKIASNGRETVINNFSWEKIKESLTGIYKNILLS